MNTNFNAIEDQDQIIQKYDLEDMKDQIKILKIKSLPRSLHFNVQSKVKNV